MPTTEQALPAGTPWRAWLRLAQFFVLTAVAIIVAILVIAGPRVLPHLGRIAAFTSVYTMVLGTTCFLVLPRVGSSHLAGRRPVLYWLQIVGALIAIGLTGALVSESVLTVSGLASPESLRSRVLTSARTTVVFTLIAGVVTTIFHRMRHSLVQRTLELERTVADTRRQLADQSQEMAAARSIQERLLPKRLPQPAGFRIAAHWSPAKEVGGDYYDVFPLEGAAHGEIALAVGDVVGKGVCAALLMSHLHAAVRAYATVERGPAAVCQQVNAVLCDNLARGKFVTFFYGVLNPAAGTFHYCRAGHNPPLVLRDGGDLERLEAGGLMLGGSRKASYAQGEVRLRPGDRLVLFTDGLTEAMDEAQQEFGEDRLATAVRQVAGGAEATVTAVLADAEAFCRGQWLDDATLVVVEAVRT